MRHRKRGKFASFIGGMITDMKGFGYGYTAVQWRLDYEAAKKGWRFWQRVRTPLRSLKWALHTGRVMSGKRSLLTGRRDFKPLFSPPLEVQHGQ